MYIFQVYLSIIIKFDPHLADEVRRNKNLTVRIGLESRVLRTVYIVLKVP